MVHCPQNQLILKGLLDVAAKKFVHVILTQLQESLIHPYSELTWDQVTFILMNATSSLFSKISVSGLGRIGCGFVEDANLLEIWNYVQHLTDFIGPFWCLRAALGPLVETYILLDRLLFLQEQGSVAEALLFPLFNPTVSPRNIAVVAWKLSTDSLKA